MSMQWHVGSEMRSRHKKKNAAVRVMDELTSATNLCPHGCFFLGVWRYQFSPQDGIRTQTTGESMLIGSLNI